MQKPYAQRTIYKDRYNHYSYCVERGGLVTSIVIDDTEILYLDKESFQSTSRSVRGGIPILFPNAGPLEGNVLFPELARHGFARDYSWQDISAEKNMKLIFSANCETQKKFPYNFDIYLFGQFDDVKGFTLHQKIVNNEIGKDLPIAGGLHPYFKVNNDSKKDIIFDFDGGNYISANYEKWSQGDYISISNPKIKNSDKDIKIIIPNIGTIILNLSVEYEHLWIWSLPGKDFICIEPVLRNINGLIDNPYLVPVKREKEIFFSINLIKTF